MTPDNPFSAPQTELLAPSSTLKPAVNQPFYFIAAMVVISALLFLGSNAWRWINDMDGYSERMADYLPMMIANWLGGLLLYAAALLLLVHHQRERHGIAQFRPLAGVLAGFAGLYLLCALLVGLAISYLSLPFYQWALEQDARTFWMVLYGQFTGGLNLLLVCLLPLWLVLRLARPRSERLAAGQVEALPSWQVALGVALCFVALAYEVLGWLNYAVPFLYSGAFRWQSVFLLGGCAVPFAIVMAAVQTRLPAQVSRFAAGRVLGAAVVLLALWAVAILLVSILIAVAAYSSLNSSSLPFYLIPPAVLLVVLLWPLARWCTGWFFAEQLARPSHG